MCVQMSVCKCVCVCVCVSVCANECACMDYVRVVCTHMQDAKHIHEFCTQN